MRLVDLFRPSPLARILLLAVRAYQFVPKLGPPRCRFFPSCSEYTVQAIERFGAVRGVALGAWRVVRCHPFSPGGIDHVPDLSAPRAE
jgi:putative membrane protein insertion efficiency factor